MIFINFYVVWVNSKSSKLQSNFLAHADEVRKWSRQKKVTTLQSNFFISLFFKVFCVCLRKKSSSCLSRKKSCWKTIIGFSFAFFFLPLPICILLAEYVIYSMPRKILQIGFRKPDQTLQFIYSLLDL